MMISTPVRRLVLTCSLVAGRGAFGRTFGSIDGEARDVAGAAVVGVTVSVTNQGKNAVSSVVTNDAGAYSFPSLAPGTYTLRAEKPGFKATVLNQIERQVQQAARIDIDLHVGQVNGARRLRVDRSKCLANGNLARCETARRDN
jgi:Carboxypeptidase regulatory-like domain